MLPAFPMDGGRALRALLATHMDGRRATRIAARFGQGMAVLFAIIGWLGNPVLILIALFVWTGAAQEARTADMRAVLSGIPVGRVMITNFTTLTPDDPLSKVMELVQHGSQHDFPVTREGRVAGMLTPRHAPGSRRGRSAVGCRGYDGSVTFRSSVRTTCSVPRWADST